MSQAGTHHALKCVQRGVPFVTYPILQLYLLAGPCEIAGSSCCTVSNRYNYHATRLKLASPVYLNTYNMVLVGPSCNL